MEFWLIVKILFFLGWPLIFVYLYYLTDKEKFKAKWKKIKESQYK